MSFLEKAELEVGSSKDQTLSPTSAKLSDSINISLPVDLFLDADLGLIPVADDTRIKNWCSTQKVRYNLNYLTQLNTINVYMIGGEIIGAYDLNRQPVDLSEKFTKLCQGIPTFQFCLIEIKYNNKNIIISRIESFPNLLEVERLGVNVTDKLMNYVISGKHEQQKVICGFQEMVTIGDISLLTKFDTGNGTISSIHAETININEGIKSVSFKIGESKFIKPIFRKILMNGGKSKFTVLMNIEFNKNKLNDIEFCLDDRTGKSAALINREVMGKLNIIVDPLKEFTIKTGV